MQIALSSKTLEQKLFHGNLTKASMRSERLVPHQIKASLRAFALPRVPKHLRANFTNIDETGRERIKQSLLANYFPYHHFDVDVHSYLASAWGHHDLEAHLEGRIFEDRSTVIPWLDQARRLNGARILEIGCGTGSSTVAMAEQGAAVTGVDVDERSLRVAEQRCKVFGRQANFLVRNSTEVAELFANQRFDFIIFYASLEHMTYHERLAAMRSTWQLLPRGSFWCVVEAPNRLWYRDDHTSCLPFFHWLPDEVAFDYSRFSPRQGFRDEFRQHSDASDRDFLRHGRGVSYHEFDLAMKPSGELKVVSSLLGFLRKHSLLWRAKAWIDGDLQFESFLAKVGPAIHRGFFQPHLDLIIQKD